MKESAYQERVFLAFMWSLDKLCASVVVMVTIMQQLPIVYIAINCLAFVFYAFFLFHEYK